MPMQAVVEKAPTFTAFRFGGTQAEIDALNTLLSGSGWSATFIDANSWRMDGPFGGKQFGLQQVVVFVTTPGGETRAVAKFPNMAAMGKRFQ
jgi:hypothetical protein